MTSELIITYATRFLSVISVVKEISPFSFNLHEETREQLTELQVKLKDAVDQLVSSFACEFEEGIQKNVLEMGRLLHRVSVTVLENRYALKSLAMDRADKAVDVAQCAYWSTPLTGTAFCHIRPTSSSLR